MNKLIEFDSSYGRIVVETGDVPDSVTRGGGASGIVERVGTTFDDALSIIQPVAELTLAQLKQLVHCPEMVEIEFGVKLTASASAFVAATGAEGNLRIKIVWKPEHSRV